MTDAQAAQIKELRMQGEGYRAIGAAVGLSRDIVRNFQFQKSISFPHLSEI